MKRKMTMVLAAMMAVGLMAGCSSGTSAETEAAAANEQTEILVAAAASLKNAYEDELIPMFQEQNPGRDRNRHLRQLRQAPDADRGGSGGGCVHVRGHYADGRSK